MTAERIAHYRIEEKIGEGGMGEVFRASDTKLNRVVAVKFLPSSLADHPDRLARFRREVMLLASLNHPHILVVHDTGDSPRGPYLVTELLQGVTLSERLAATGAKGLEVSQAARIALQIARGLEAAHGQGVIHRDLKPGNLFLTADDHVKILDFGLAKSVARSPEVEATEDWDATVAPHSLETQVGVVVGTPAYMSPEQIRGESVDARADLFGLGCILHEMLTGHRAFGRDSVAETISAVLNEPPSARDRLPESLPPAMDKVVSRCLEKTPAKRFQTASDLAFALEHTTSPETLRTLAPSSVPRRHQLSWTGKVTALVTAILIGYFVGTRAKPNSVSQPAAAPPRQLEVYFSTPDDEPLQDDLNDVTLAPNGSRLAYVNAAGLWLRALDRIEPAKLLVPGAGIRGPDWSPDSQEIAYYDLADKQLHRIHINAQRPQVIGSFDPGAPPIGAGGVWFADGKWVFTSWRDGLFQVSANGGVPERVLPLGEGERQFSAGGPLPNGSGMLFSVLGPSHMGQINAWFRDGRRQTLLEIPHKSVTAPVYSPTGHIVFTQYEAEPEIWAIAVSPTTWQTQGEPFRVTSGWQANLAEDGTLLATQCSEPLRELVWLDRSGQVVESVGQPLPGLASGKVSHDGRKIAADTSTKASRWDIWIIDIARQDALLLDGAPTTDIAPYWHPNGEQIFFRHWAYGDVSVRSALIGGTGVPTTVAEGFPLLLSRSGRFLIVTDPGFSELWTLDIEAPQKRQMEFPEPFRSISNLQLSSDEKYLAYTSRETRSQELYVVDFPTFTNKTPISRGMGADGAACWHPERNELLFLSKDKSTLYATTQVDAGFSPAEPVFRLPASIRPNRFDVAADGRLLMVRTISERDLARPHAILLENWTARP